MESLIKLASYLAIGCVLLAVNAWFINRAKRAFGPNRLPSVIAPLTLVGQEDKDGTKGYALSRMLQARIGRIQEDIAYSNRALDAAKGPLVSMQTAREDLPKVKPIELPNQIFDPPDIEVKVGGVEVGGILSWAHKAATKNDILMITVHYENGEASVSGSIDEGGTTLWIDNTGPSEKSIINDIAYAIAHHAIADRQPEMGALDRKEFQGLITTVRDLAELNKQISRGRRPTTERYAKLLPVLRDIVAQTPRWRELIRLTAQTAENAESLALAIDLYGRELELSDKESPGSIELKGKIDHLREQLAKNFDRRAPVASVEEGTWISRMVGADDISTPPGTRIGIVGDAPFPGTLDTSRIKVLEDPGERGRSGSGLTEYVTSLVSAVQLVAPDASFVFYPVGEDFSTVSLVEAVDALTREGVDAVLIAYRLDVLGGPGLWTEALYRLAQRGSLLVFSAGNQFPEPVAFANHPLLDQAMVVAAVDEQGDPASFTQRHERAFWAPGERIPVRLKDRVELQSGTSYSAAIAAGVAARFRRQRPELGIRELLDILRAESKPVGPAAGPPVINLRAALTLKDPGTSASR